MRNLALILILITSTLVQAGSFNSQDQTTELTYDDLMQELSAKKSSYNNSSTQILGFSRVQASFGYSFSSMDFDLATGSSTFALSGLDLRVNGQLPQSAWQIEASFKNYARVSSGDKAAENHILGVALKNQDVLNSTLQYVAGFGSSFNLIQARDAFKKQNEMDMSLNVMGGVRGYLSQQLSWGAELGAYSPISGQLLKGGWEASIMINSTL